MKKSWIMIVTLFAFALLSACSQAPTIPEESSLSVSEETESIVTEIPTEPSLYSPCKAADYAGMNYVQVEAQLRKAGFINILLTRLDDLTSDSTIADGAVESVVIDDFADFTESTPFDSDANIVIVYHHIPKATVPISTDNAVNAHYMAVGKLFFDAGFAAVETDEVYDLPAYAASETKLLVNGAPVHANEELPFDSEVRVIGHYPVAHYNTTIHIDFKENWLFSRYDVVVKLNGEELGTLPHGQDGQFTRSLTAGRYVLTFEKYQDAQKNGQVEFEVNSGTTATFRISCYMGGVDAEQTELIRDLSENALLMPFSIHHYLRKDYADVVAELQTLGFTDVTPVPCTDHLWAPSPINTVVKVCIGSAESFEQDGQFSKSSPVKVFYHVADFAFDTTNLTVTEKDIFELPYTMTSGDKLSSLSFDIDNPQVLQRNADGSYTAQIPGTAIVTVSGGGHIYSSCTVEVKEIVVPIEGVVFAQDEQDIVVGSTFTLDYTILPADANYTDILTTMSEPILEELGNGTFYAKEAGDTQIVFYQDDRMLGSCMVHTKIVDIEQLLPAESMEELFIGEDTELMFDLLPENATCKGINVVSSNSKVAKVEFDERGAPVVKVTGLAAGTTTVTITIPNGQSYTYSLVVKEVMPTKLQVVNTKPNARIEVGTPILLDILWEPESVSVKDVSWESSNKKVIKINADGKPEAVGVGTADLTAKHKSGVSGMITLYVEPTLVTGISVSSNQKTDEKFCKGDKFTITATVSPENATNKTVKFESSDTSVVKVSSKGVVTAVGQGTAIITVLSADGPSKTVDVTVSPSPQKFRIKWSASLLATNHVGSSWRKSFEVNGKTFSSGSTVTLSPDADLIIDLTITEQDSRPDTGGIYERIPYSKELCENGYKISEVVYVTENSGRYSGNSAEWKVTITITPVG